MTQRTLSDALNQPEPKDWLAPKRKIASKVVGLAFRAFCFGAGIGAGLALCNLYFESVYPICPKCRECPDLPLNNPVPKALTNPNTQP